MAAMAYQDPFKGSIVSDLIKFEPTECPQWRNKGNEDAISTSRMIQEIIESQRRWKNEVEGRLSDAKRRTIKERMMTKFYEINTDPLKDDSVEEITRKQQEMHNFRDAIWLLEMAEVRAEVAEENESRQLQDCQFLSSGLLEESLLREANKTLMKGVAKQNRTKPGHFSDELKCMTYNGELYRYQYPENMENAVFVFLDRYNSLITASLAESDEEVRFKSVFNTAAWLVVEFLHLHPFSDGNGRLCRILCNYVVSTLKIPFPTPIYHIYEYKVDQNSENTPRNLPCRDDYLRAFVTSRMLSQPTHPCEMAAMIIESNWRGWKEFMNEVQKELESG